jgi:hypothetical protein
MTKYPTRLFIKCPECKRPILAQDDDGVGDYTAVCYNEHCGTVYFGLHTGTLDPPSIEILDILPATEYLAHLGWHGDEGLGGRHYLSERVADEMGIGRDLRQAMLNDAFVLVRTNEEPVPLVKKKYPIFCADDKYGTIDFDGTIFKVVVSEFFTELLEEAVVFFSPLVNCGCGSFATHDCGDRPCCGGIMCCPDANK